MSRSTATSGASDYHYFYLSNVIFSTSLLNVVSIDATLTQEQTKRKILAHEVALASEQGGYDLLTYCTKHIIQAFNNKTAMTKVMGNPWERIMMSQGPTPMIVDLYLKVCEVESNLLAVNKIGGHKALHNLSRYGDSTEVRQTATMLLTKLAVILSDKATAAQPAVDSMAAAAA